MEDELRALWDKVPELVVARITAILLVAWVLSRLVRTTGRAYLARLEKLDLTDEEMAQRQATLVNVFSKAARMLVWTVVLVVVLTELGVNWGALLGAAGVLGVVVGFGAQNLIRDFLSGFFILVENQYHQGDEVRIGTLRGVVETVTLRTTTLRDGDGGLHVVPNGTITAVTNYTHLFSRALLDVGVPHAEVDRALEVLRELGDELAGDPRVGPLLTRRPEVLGVESIGENAVVVRVVLETRPGRHGVARREMNRRILRRFAELHIELPVPPRRVLLRATEPPPLERHDQAPRPS